MRTRLVGFAMVGMLVSTFGAGAKAEGRGAGAQSQSSPLDATGGLPEILGQDNRRPAGELRGGVLALRLEATTGLWYPEGASGPVRTVQAFAEEGRAPEIPGPLVRVREGVEIHLTVRNRIPGSALRLYGMMTRPGDPNASVEIAAGAVRELRFRAGAPGTYWYWATTTGVPLNERRGVDTQLTGAFIVDPAPGGQASDDRTFVISEWFGDLDPTGLRPVSLAINGRSWPHTERLVLPFGQAVTWRVINGSFGYHPMHLHGTFFTVESRGNVGRDTLYGADNRRLVTTESLEPGGTMLMRWVPDRVGNWLFHCHVLAHVSGEMRLGDRPPAERSAPVAHGEHDVERVMAGLVMGIKVLPGDETAAPDLEPHERRALKLFMQSIPNRYGTNPGFGFSIVEGEGPAPRLEAPTNPSPTLVLTRGEPVVITLVNQIEEETSIHWHGLELESYNDGVPGWSGDGTRLLPAVRPGEALDVRFTPPRAGTFIYHTHGHDRRQLSSGLYAALIVMDPGQTFDAEVERVVLLGGAGPGSPAVEVNRSTNPAPMTLRVGVKHRFRLINITSNFEVVVWLRGEAPLQWKPIAKDGADLPSAHSTPRMARQDVAVGETYDFEYEPTAPGELRLEAYRSRGVGATVTSMIVRVVR